MNKIDAKSTITVDATSTSMGRLASVVAKILIGKTDPCFQKNKTSHQKVKITNLDKCRFTGKKANEKEYRSHSQYPGGLKIKYAKHLSQRQIFLRTINGMLPKNKQRGQLLKRIIIQ